MKKSILTFISGCILTFGALSQNVNIPDANFKAYLVGNTSINTNIDSEIQITEANTFNGSITCQNLGIADLTGIEAFTEITSLYCYSNNLTNLDLSNNPDLLTIYCHTNNINSLNVSNNVALTDFRCNSNDLSNLDVSNNIALTTLYFGSNDLIEIDLSNNINLIQVFCYSGNLIDLDLSNNTGLTQISCGSNNLSRLNVANGNNTNFVIFSATNNPNLDCIQVDNSAYSGINWSNIDGNASFSNAPCPLLVQSITVQGESGVDVIDILNGTLQMEVNIVPSTADNNTYTWSIADGTGSASISASGLVTAIAEGTVIITATANDASGVSGNTTITISNQNVGVEVQNFSNNISIYPNPVKSQLTINSDIQIEKIVIVDILGEAIESHILPYKSINISHFNNGVYLLQLYTDKGLIIKKFIKE